MKSQRHLLALAMAAQGLPVFPCRADKSPVPPDGFKGASTDLWHINRWWDEGDWWPAFEPERAGLAVVDLDVKNGVDGPGNWRALLNGDARQTYSVTTPSGGTHLYFRGSLPPSAGKLGPGIDTRGRKSYVLVYGDRFPEAWEIADLPPWVAERCAVVDTPKRQAQDADIDSNSNVRDAIAEIRRRIKRDGPPAHGEGHNERTYKLAAWMRDHGISAEKRIELMIAEGWTDEPHALNTATNPDKYGQNEPGSDADPPVARLAAYVEDMPEVQAMDQEKIPNVNKQLEKGDMMSIKEIRWIWPGWLAEGKFHILGGQKAAGKSTIAFDIMATITTGGKFPDGAKATPGQCLIWSGEDDWHDTILPRIAAAGGDVTRVYRVARSAKGEAFNPAYDMVELIGVAAGIPDLKLLVIDSIASAVAGGHGATHNNAETRQGLQPVLEFAEATGAAVLGITHFTKGSQGAAPVERITGSLAFGALPRVVWGAVKGDDEDGIRRLAKIEVNIGKGGGGFEYTIKLRQVPGHQFSATTISWGQAIEGNSITILGLAAGKRDKLREAGELLESLLFPAGDMGVEVKELKTAAQAHGISWITMERARADIGRIITPRKNLGHLAGWSWVWGNPIK